MTRLLASASASSASRGRFDKVAIASPGFTCVPSSARMFFMTEGSGALISISCVSTHAATLLTLVMARTEALALNKASTARSAKMPRRTWILRRPI